MDDDVVLIKGSKIEGVGQPATPGREFRVGAGDSVHSIAKPPELARAKASVRFVAAS